jgi:integrase
MATVRKISRTTRSGATTVRYQVRWVDPPKEGEETGQRRSRKFKLRAPADSFKAKVEYRLQMGLPGEETAETKPRTPTVYDVCQAWLNRIEDLVKNGRREQSTLNQYEQHVRLHIAPDAVSKIEIAKLTAPDCAGFAQRLEATKHPEMAKKVFTSFKSALSDAVAAGTIGISPATEVGVDTRSRILLGEAEADSQERVRIPELHEVRAVMDAARLVDNDGRALAIMMLSTFPGLRISETRGLGLPHLLLFGDEQAVKVRRRADESGKLGPPKSKAGYRTIVIGHETVAALRAWLEHITPNSDSLLFATDGGRPYTYAHLYRHVLIPVMVKATERGADLVTLRPKVDNDGQPIVRDGGHFAGPYCPLIFRPKYSFHEFRHVAASLRIAGGARPKDIQKLMGHSSIKVTMDIYGHLWHDADQSAAEARAAETLVMNAVKKGGT